MNDANFSHSRTLARYSRLRRFNVLAFYIAMIGVFGGFAVGLAGLEVLGSVAVTTGFALAGLLIAESFLIIPFLKCPSCRHPFFTPRGWIALLHRINPHNQRCLNCGLSIDQEIQPEGSADNDGQQ